MTYCCKPYRQLMLSFIIACLTCSIGVKQATAGGTADFRNLVFDKTEHFTLESVVFDKDTYFLRAEYKYKPIDTLDKTVTLFLEYDSQEKIREKAKSIRSTFEIHWAVEYSEMREALSEKKAGRIYDKLQELQNPTGYIQWQKQHGNLLNEHPEINLFPLKHGPFTFSSFNPEHVKFSANYDIKNEEARGSITLIHGEAARQAGERALCGKKEKVTINGISYHSQQGMRSHTLKTRQENVFLSLVLRNTHGMDEETITTKITSLAESLDLAQIKRFDFQPIERPGNGIKKVALDADKFKSFFPQKSGNLSLQRVHAYEDAMHIRADYLYKPEDQVVSMHMAYMDYGERLKTGLRGRSVGNFRIAYEVGCLEEKLSRKEIGTITENLETPSETAIAKWEMQNIDFSQANSLAKYFPIAFETYTIRSFQPKTDDLEVNTKYAIPGRKAPVLFSVNYGKKAAKEYHKYLLATFEETKEKIQFKANGLSFDAIESKDHLFAVNYQDQLLLKIGLKKQGENADKAGIVKELQAFLSAFDVSRFEGWQPPGNFEQEFSDTLEDGTKICMDTECMEKHLANCQPAAFGGRLNYNLGVLYKIEEKEGDHCRLSMTYTANPNDQWEDKPLYFSIDREAGFAASVKETVKNCLEGKSDNCAGPLMKMIGEE